MKLMWTYRRGAAGMLALACVALFSVRISTAAEWRVDTVDSGATGRFVSLKIDRSGNAHVAYIPDEDRHPLMYAFWDHTINRWFTMMVAQYASFCTLTLDSHQRPNISYADHGTGRGTRLRYARWDGSEWKTQAVSPPTEAVVGYYTGIGLDAKDKPVFSYYEYQSPAGDYLIRLRTVYPADGYWGVQVVDPQQGSGKFNSLAIDSTGRPHIAYANVKAESASLRYAVREGDKWKLEVLEGVSGAMPIYSVNLALDKNDNPHIAYTDVAARLVKYAYRKNGAWELETVDRLQKEAYPDRNGIAIDDDGTPYISYYDAGAGTLNVATRRGSTWYREVLVTGFAGFTPSLQVANGYLWVAYGDEGGGGVKLAKRPLERMPEPDGPPVPPGPHSNSTLNRKPLE